MIINHESKEDLEQHYIVFISKGSQKGKNTQHTFWIVSKPLTKLGTTDNRLTENNSGEYCNKSSSFRRKIVQRFHQTTMHIKYENYAF